VARHRNAVVFTASSEWLPYSLSDALDGTANAQVLYVSLVGNVTDVTNRNVPGQRSR
jgi:hypothetical protein